MRLDKSFFKSKDTITLTKELLGKVLVYETEKGTIKGIINETEAYTQEDVASHTFNRNVTKRNKVMFMEEGHFYVYLTYGMYHCCNIVTESEGRGCAVLIRSVIPIEGEEIMIENRGKNKNISDGPGKLCMAYEFHKEHSGLNLLSKDSKIYLEDLGHKPKDIQITKRIGISKGIDKKWRFLTNKF